MMKKLVLFTNSFPYGKGENWIYDELMVLHQYFAITVVPLTYEGNREQRWELPEGVTLAGPLFEDNSSFTSSVLSVIPEIFKRNIAGRMRELFGQKVFLKRYSIRQYLNHIALEEKLLSHSLVMQLLNQSDTAFYFYWGLGAAQLIPALPASRQKILVRMHGYDLYDHRNNGYIPFRSALLKKVSLVLPVSDNGRKYLIERYPFSKNKVIVSRLGTMQAGISEPDSAGQLSLFSCSTLISLKRVHLIAGALGRITDIKVKWTHLGDGPERGRIEQIIAGLPGNISVELKRQLLPHEIPAQYAGNNAGLFLHVSETEGVPVAIMEALAASIPVMATNVGGTAEIVDQSVGFLLDPAITEDQLADKIRSFYLLPAEKKHLLRQGALERFNTMCKASENAHSLAKLISQIMADQPVQ